jgi:hypothetical protein
MIIDEGVRTASAARMVMQRGFGRYTLARIERFLLA